MKSRNTHGGGKNGALHPSGARATGGSRTAPTFLEIPGQTAVIGEPAFASAKTEKTNVAVERRGTRATAPVSISDFGFRITDFGLRNLNSRNRFDLSIL